MAITSSGPVRVVGADGIGSDNANTTGQPAISHALTSQRPDLTTPGAQHVYYQAPFIVLS